MNSTTKNVRFAKKKRHCLSAVLAVAVLFGLHGLARGNDHGGHEEHAPAAKMPLPESAAFSTRGIELGEFRIRAYYPLEGQKCKVSFTLYAIVDKKQFAESEELFAHRQQKLRDQVIIATRLAPLVVYDDAELKSFRKRILLRVRRAMPELSIDDVYVSDFNLAVEGI
jgi:hypothetical protein